MENKGTFGEKEANQRNKPENSHRGGEGKRRVTESPPSSAKKRKERKNRGKKKM